MKSYRLRMEKYIPHDVPFYLLFKGDFNMLELIIFFYIAILALAIYLQYILASFFANVAEEKGYHEKRYFWTPFWLGIVGYLLVIALPDKYARTKKSRYTICS